MIKIHSKKGAYFINIKDVPKFMHILYHHIKSNVDQKNIKWLDIPLNNNQNKCYE